MLVLQHTTMLHSSCFWYTCLCIATRFIKLLDVNLRCRSQNELWILLELLSSWTVFSHSAWYFIKISIVDQRRPCRRYCHWKGFNMTSITMSVEMHIWDIKTFSWTVYNNSCMKLNMISVIYSPRFFFFSSFLPNLVLRILLALWQTAFVPLL